MRGPNGTTRRDGRTRRTFLCRYGFEPLEDRVVPTIVFPPHYGAEQVTDGGGWKVKNATIVPVFWGTYWGQTQNAPTLLNDLNSLQYLASSSYFSGLGQYVGGTPQVSVTPTTLVDTSKAPPGPVLESTLVSKVNNELSQDILSGALPSPTSYGSSQPVYVFITDPSTYETDSTPGLITNGWNTNGSVPVPKTIGQVPVPEIWVDGGLPTDT
jgi:hypothetical protein